MNIEYLEMASLWVRISLYSALGPLEGELVYRRVPALFSFQLFSRTLETTGEV